MLEVSELKVVLFAGLSLDLDVGGVWECYWGSGGITETFYGLSEGLGGGGASFYVHANKFNFKS